MRDATPEPPAPTPSATWYCNKCGKVGDAATRARAEKQHAIVSPGCNGLPEWSPVPPASAPAATAEPEEDRCHSGPECVRCGRREIWRPDGSCHFFVPNPAAPTGEEPEPRAPILTDAVIGTFYDAANDAKKDAGGSLFYRWNDPTPAWQEGIGKAFFRDFALRIAGHVASRYAAEYTAQATELAALRARETELTALLRRVEHDLMTVPYNAQTPFDVISGVAAAIRAALAPRQPTGSQP